jgi:hypothetical protein
MKAPARSEIQLEFPPDEDGTEHPLQALSVLCRSVSRNEFNKLTDLDIDEQLEKFITEYVIEWDLQHQNGKIVALTMADVGEEEAWIALAIMNAWGRALYRVPTPLAQS